MERLYTKNGRPLRVNRDRVFVRSGHQVGRIRGERVFGPDGRYVGSIVGDRLVYRSTQSASISCSFTPSNRMGFMAMDRLGSMVWGDEPPIPD